MLSAKEQLYQHIDELPNELAQEVLDFLLFVKTRRDRPGNNGISRTNTSTVEIDRDGEVRPVWEIVAEIGSRIPEEEWKKVPTDLARNFKKYQNGQELS